MKFIRYNDKSANPKNSNGRAQISHLNELQKQSNNAITKYELLPLTIDSSGNLIYLYSEDLGNNFSARENTYFPNVDLTFGNFHSIYLKSINDNPNSGYDNLKLPEYNKENLLSLVMESSIRSTEYEFNISEYKNLRNVKLYGNYNNQALPSLTITDDIIDLPFCTNFIAGRSKRTRGVFTKNNNITYNIYGGKLQLLLESQNTDEITLDFKNLKSLQVTNGAGLSSLNRYDIDISLSFFDNIKINNLPQIKDQIGYFRLSFDQNSLPTESVDNILKIIDESFPDTYVPYEGQSDTDYNFILKLKTENEVVDTFEIIDQGLPCPDGIYNSMGAIITYKDGIITDVKIQRDQQADVDEIIVCEDLFLYSKEYPFDITFANILEDEFSPIDHFVKLKVLTTKQNGIPTNGVSNENYVSLINKGWIVEINE